MASITKRGGVYRAQIRRREKYTSQTFRTLSAAREWARRVENAIDEGRWNDTPSITVAEAVDRYELDHRSSTPLSKTKRSALRQLKTSSMGGIDLAALEPSDIVEHCKSRTCGPATLLAEVNYLSQLFEYARIVWGHSDLSDPVGRARPTLKRSGLIRKAKSRDRRPSTDELRCLESYLLSNTRMPMCDIMRFAIASAMRLGEITRIRWEDLDQDKGLVLIRDRKCPSMKQGNHQWVPLLDQAWTIVMAQARTDERIFPFHPDSISRAWTNACKRLNIADLRFHDLRHEGASRLFEHGFGIHEVSLITGHRRWESLKRYTQLDPASLHAKYVRLQSGRNHHWSE